jgi:hypothetical protein
MSLMKLDGLLNHQGTPTFRDRPPLPLVEITDPGGFRFPETGTPPRYWRLGECSVILTHDGRPFGWHLSIAHPHRYPKWDEIAEARYRCMKPEITVAMLLPPMEEYINVHKNCFQLHEIPDEANLISMYEAWRMVIQSENMEP